MLKPSATGFEFIIDINMVACGDVKAFEVGAPLKDGEDPYVCQAVACHLKNT